MRIYRMAQKRWIEANPIGIGLGLGVGLNMPSNQPAKQPAQPYQPNMWDKMKEKLHNIGGAARYKYKSLTPDGKKAIFLDNETQTEQYYDLSTVNTYLNSYKNQNDMKMVKELQTALDAFTGSVQ